MAEPVHSRAELDDTDLAIIKAMIDGSTAVEIASSLSIGIATVYRRRSAMAFQAALTEARAAQFVPVMSEAVRTMPDVVRTFREIVADADAKNADRINAGKAVLDVALKLSDQVDMRAGLAAVQAELARLNGRASLSESEAPGAGGDSDSGSAEIGQQNQS